MESSAAGHGTKTIRQYRGLLKAQHFGADWRWPALTNL